MKTTMNDKQRFKMNMIAPCGINCTVCYAHLREKNKCPGCRNDKGYKAKSCLLCKIKNCENREAGQSGYCYECNNFPCQRLKQLDKRYRTKYGTGLVGNLQSIKALGIRKYNTLEKERWLCKHCGEVLCIHRRECDHCGKPWW